MSASPQTHVLWHGTTRHRAESIRENGPDPTFREPGGQPDPEDIGGFSAAPPEVVCLTGTPADVARAKDKLFPNEGGPAILEVEVPEDVYQLAIHAEGGEVRFQPGDGLEELLELWPDLPKRVILT